MNIIHSYKSNTKYIILFVIGFIFFLFSITVGIFTIAVGDDNGIYLILFGFLLLLILIVVVPKEIELGDEGIRFKTLIKSTEIPYSEIKTIKSYYKTTELLFRDKKNAQMLCIILLKRRPYKFLLFGNSLINYKELYANIEAKIT